MINQLSRLILAFFSVLVLAHPSQSIGRDLTVPEISQELERLDSNWSQESFPSDHPNVVIEKSIKALKLYKQGRLNEAEDILSKLFSKNRFEIPNQEITKVDQEVNLATLGSISLWRDLAYIVMARVNYDTKRYKIAEKFYSAVSKQSPLSSFAQSERVWTLVHLQDDEKLKELLPKVKLYGVERKLVESYLKLRVDDYKKAISILESIEGYTDPKMAQIGAMFKLHAYFFEFISEKAKKSFNANVVRVKRIIQLSKDSGFTREDSRIAYLMGETHWHLASLYRIEDPDRFAELSKQSLIQGDRWLGYWFNQSLRAKKALLPEEALFLSAIILWEADQQRQAIRRLEQIPEIFPSGEYLEDAYQLLGDYYFEKRMFSKALDNFRKLTKVGNEEKTAYGTYKAAWCFYNLKQKFKALRHFQRLTRYYLDFSKTNKELLPGNLSKEAYKDMMIMLAELTTFAEAKGELDHLQLTQGRQIEVLEELTSFYEKMGRFKEAVAGYEYLLTTHQKNPRVWVWMYKMSKAHLARGRRQDIAAGLSRHINKAKLVEDQKNRDEFLLEFEKLLLTVQKEARKTDDGQIFAVVDDLYGFWKSHFFELQKGRLLYFGAQRFERKGDLWEATAWYKQASKDESFKNYKDSALSVMNIVVSESDRLSLESKVNPESWVPVFENSKWVYQLEMLSDQRLAVAKHLFEAAHNIGKLDFIDSELVSLFRKRGFEQRLAFLYFQENKRRYKKKDFEKSYNLAKSLFKFADQESKNQSEEIRKKRQEFKAAIVEIAQESAFQIGFKLDATEDKRRVEEARRWFKISASESPQTDIAFRAWYNELIGFSEETEMPRFLSRLEEFRKARDLSKSRLSFEQVQLAEKLIRREVGHYESKKLWSKQYKALGRLIPYLNDTEKNKAVFRRLVLSALLNYSKDFSDLVIQYTQLVENPSVPEMEFISRSYEWFGQEEESFDWLKKILDKNKKPDSSIALLIRDKIVAGAVNRASYKRELQAKYFKGKFKLLKDQALLLTSWHQVLDIIAFKTLAQIDTQLKKRSISSVPLKKPGQELQKRLGKVGEILGQLNSTRKSLYKLARHWSPRIKREAICRTSSTTEKFKGDLAKLKTPALKHPQFKDFVAQVENKENELSSEIVLEQKACEEQTKVSRYLNLVKRGQEGYFCSYVKCRSTDIPESFVATEKLSMERFYQLLSNPNTWAMADDLSRVNLNAEAQKIQFVAMRLFKGDLWNARQLFLSLIKDMPGAKDSLYLVGALISNAAKDTDEGSKYYRMINPEALSGLEKSIYQRLSTEFTKLSSR